MGQSHEKSRYVGTWGSTGWLGANLCRSQARGGFVGSDEEATEGWKTVS